MIAQSDDVGHGGDLAPDKLGNPAARDAFVREVIKEAGYASREKFLAQMRRMLTCGSENLESQILLAFEKVMIQDKQEGFFVQHEDEETGKVQEKQEDEDADHSDGLVPWLRCRPRR